MERYRLMDEQGVLVDSVFSSYEEAVVEANALLREWSDEQKFTVVQEVRVVRRPLPELDDEDVAESYDSYGKK